MNAKKKQQKIESMTIEQFKTFIKGLSFFDENWVPNKEQWEHIKALIDNLKIEAPIVQQVVQHAQQYQNNGVNFPQQPMQGEVDRGEVMHPHAPGQRNFLGQPGRSVQRQARDNHGNPIAVDPRTEERRGNETILPASVTTGSDFI